MIKIKIDDIPFMLYLEIQKKTLLSILKAKFVLDTTTFLLNNLHIANDQILYDSI